MTLMDLWERDHQQAKQMVAEINKLASSHETHYILDGPDLDFLILDKIESIVKNAYCIHKDL